MKMRLSMLSGEEKLSTRKQCELLSVNRSNLYYKPLAESDDNLKIMRMMDEHYIKHPTSGVLRMRDHLWTKGINVNPKRVRRLLRLMGLMAIYPKRNLSKLGKAEYIHPYLLRNITIERPNQAWAIDITYIPMAKGFMYLTAIIDIYSRFIVGWGISNSLDASCSLNVLKEAIRQHGKPDIINSDQGCQFTSQCWVEYLKSEEIKISMDGKGRAIDNIFIERFWRSVKYDYVYINCPKDGLELYAGLKEYISYYNNEQYQQGIDEIPIRKYNLAA